MLTLIIASYKYGHLAAHCVETILGQSVSPTKIYFVDDAVGDCKHIEKLYGSDLEFIQNETNLGVVDNFQNMLNKVETEYCMFLGADNWLRSDAVELFMNCISEKNPDIITYDMMLTGEKKVNRLPVIPSFEIAPWQGDYYWFRQFKWHGSMVYRASMARQVGGYSKRDPNSKFSEEDHSLWNKMTAQKANVTYINHTLLYYRHHRENFNVYVDD